MWHLYEVGRYETVIALVSIGGVPYVPKRTSRSVTTAFPPLLSIGGLTSCEYRLTTTHARVVTFTCGQPTSDGHIGPPTRLDGGNGNQGILDRTDNRPRCRTLFWGVCRSGSFRGREIVSLGWT